MGLLKNLLFKKEISDDSNGHYYAGEYRPSDCDEDCLGCEHLDYDCDGDSFTDWLLYDADDDEW